jgi:selenocysteine-specific elongation factor
MILGLAGHIDHGKTALVHALTGVDTDRLPEEKRRGITIELGFAPLRLEGIGVIGVVDVPGHEAFVRTMLAGATGVDLALLVVAADEGVMPQTREHLAILELLGVRTAAVVLTKRDLVDDDWIALVREDVDSLLEPTPLAGSPIVETSVVTRQGIDELRGVIATLARQVPARDPSDVFRLPVDRAFTIKGTGTVVTGTVWSGSIDRDRSVRIFPLDRVARVRTVQTHGASVDRAEPGSRTALALVGVNLEDVERGTVVVEDHPAWKSTLAFRADVSLLDDAPQALRPRTIVRLHVGTIEVGARIVTPSGSLQPGELTTARIVVDQPIVVRAGDRFVLRSASPVATIGGGVVTDPAIPPRAKPLPQVAMTIESRLAYFVSEAGGEGVSIAELPIRLGVSPTRATELTSGWRSADVISGRLVSRDATEALTRAILSELARCHAEHPLEPGQSLQYVRSKLGGRQEVFDAMLGRLIAEGRVKVVEGLVSLADWEPTAGARDLEVIEKLCATLEGAGSEPPDVSELAAEFGTEVEALLRFLERGGRIVQVEKSRYYAVDNVKQLLDRLSTSMDAGREYAPAELRDVLGISRKYLIPFLEYCDRIGFTIRHQTGRTKRESYRLPAHFGDPVA